MLTRQSIARLFLLGGCLLATGCGDRASRAPNPTEYDWPEQFAYRLDYVSEPRQNGRPIERYTESKTTRFVVRDAQYFGALDGVLKTSARPGELPRLLPASPQDTLGFYVSLGRRGEITRVELACDPALAACAAALPSSVALELRRVIPRLPIFEAPRGASWEDTLRLDDAARPGGTRGAMLTRYTGRGDTTLFGRAYWVIDWRSVRSSEAAGRAASAPPIREDGVTFVEKARLMPVFATWAGVAPPSPELRRMGATGTGHRGRAYLAGSVFDSLYSERADR